MRGLFERKRICVCFFIFLFLLFVYSVLTIVVWDPIIKKGLGVTFTSLTPPHFNACLKIAPGFPTPCRGIFCIQWFDVRGCCLLLIYFWNCCPSQIIISFHDLSRNTKKCTYFVWLIWCCSIFTKKNNVMSLY